MSAGNDQNEVWRLGPLPEPVSWAVGIFLALLILALVVRVAIEVTQKRCPICDQPIQDLGDHVAFGHDPEEVAALLDRLEP